MTLALEHLPTYLAWTGVLVVCAGLDALYCGLETGMYVINKIRLELHAEGGHGPARTIRRLLDHPNNLLAVLLIGTNLMRYVATFAITSMFLLAGAGERAELYTILVATPVLFVVGDAVPKSTFRRLGEKPVYALSWLLRLSNGLFRVTLLSPVVLLFSTVIMKITGAGKDSDQAIFQRGVAEAMSEGEASGVVTHFQSVMADRVMNLSQVTLSAAMVPLERVVSAGTHVGRPELLELYRNHEVSRLPLLDAQGRIVGIIDIQQAVINHPDRAPAEIMTAPLLMPRELPITQALYRMQRHRAGLAVVEAHGRHVGIVTIKDLVEEIVGDIEDW